MVLQTENPKLVSDRAFLAAKIRALKAKILAGPDLVKLAFLESPLVFYRQVLGTTQDMTPAEAQRAVLRRHVWHLAHILNFTRGRESALFEWLLRRYEVENLKVVIRAWARKMRPGEIERDLVPMPRRYALPVEKMLSAEDVGALASFIPEERFVAAMPPVMHRFMQHDRVFFLEAAVEKAYYTEALRLAGRLFRTNRHTCLPMIQREALCYNIVFVLRCLQTYQLPPEIFSDLVVPYGHFGGAGYMATFLTNPVESLLETIPHFESVNPDRRAVASVGDIEDICARYLYRAARKQFAASIFDFGAVVSYCYLKRFELQDILRLGEALRLGLSAEEARHRLITAGEEYA